MNVTVVDWDISYPATSGKRLRTLNLMLRLARRHRITYIGRGNACDCGARQAAVFLEDHGIETLLVDHPLPHKSGIGYYGRLAANLLAPVPYAVTVHESRPMRQAVQGHAARRRVDLWQFEWTPYVATTYGLSGARVLMAHNVDSLIWQRYYETERQPLKRWYIKQQWRKFQSYERRMFEVVTRVVAVSAEDGALVRDQFGIPHVDVVDNGVDKDYFENVTGNGECRQILFLGSLDWRPNVDALGLMMDQIFPRVLAQEPEARLCVVGRNPSAALIRRLASEHRVELYADVADVRPFLGASGVLAVPLRIGGGSRLKILEALAAGLPVVSTRVGAEGLHLQAGRDMTVVEGVADMAAALVECIRRPGAARAMARAGRAVVREQYDWDVLATKLERVWEQAIQAPPDVRSPSDQIPPDQALQSDNHAVKTRRFENALS
jgi:glycosyltransferase involved in cell wall biosynthesis